MSTILVLKKPEVQRDAWKQTLLFPLDPRQPIRGVDYDTFMKFYKLCPIWAIRYKKRQVNQKWKKMGDPKTCVMGEFSGWLGGWSNCRICKNFGFSGSDGKPGFWRGSDFSWRKTIPLFVRHVEQYHPERLRDIINR